MAKRSHEEPPTYATAFDERKALPRRFFFVVNQQSGNYLKWFVQMRIGDFCTTEGVSGEVHYLRDTDTLRTNLERAYQEGYRDFAVAGGDGSVSLVASLLRGKDCRLAIIPIGTTNMLAQLLHIPQGARRSLQLLLSSHRTRAVDALDINHNLYFLNASVGLSSYSISDLRTAEKSYFKLLAYVLAVIRSMRKAKTRTFTIVADGQTFTMDAAEILVDNAGAMWMPRYRTSDAQIDDGKADICCVRKGSPIELGNAILDVFLVRKKRLSIQFITSAQAVSLDCAEHMPVQADGDLIGYTPVDITVIPEATQFIVPETGEQAH